LRLGDLARIEGVEAELERLLDQLREARLFLPTGVLAWFTQRLPAIDPTSLDDEVASVYASVAAHLGWARPDRVLDSAQHEHVKRYAVDIVSRDATAADVTNAIGSPSYVFGDVHAYARADAFNGWVFFDYHHVPHWPGHHARVGAPPTSYRLRNVRLPTGQWYSERVLVTPFGAEFTRDPASGPALTLIVLRCADLKRSVQFCSALGLRLVREKHGEGPDHFSSKLGSTVIELYPRGELNTDGVRVGLRVTGNKDLLERAVDAGGKVLKPWTDVDVGARVVLQDPDGHTVDIVVVGCTTSRSS
jgi:catechol 2,3-dioxygenase-like lactoylglutathione lyase family enzyme